MAPFTNTLHAPIAAAGAVSPTEPTTQTVLTEPGDPYPHPDLPPAANWPGVMVIIIVIGFFGTAMVLGPIVRAIMEEDKE